MRADNVKKFPRRPYLTNRQRGARMSVRFRSPLALGSGADGNVLEQRERREQPLGNARFGVRPTPESVCARIEARRLAIRTTFRGCAAPTPGTGPSKRGNSLRTWFRPAGVRVGRAWCGDYGRVFGSHRVGDHARSAFRRETSALLDCPREDALGHSAKGVFALWEHDDPGANSPAPVLLTRLLHPCSFC
jgi:hypothetical protein